VRRALIQRGCLILHVRELRLGLKRAVYF